MLLLSISVPSTFGVNHLLSGRSPPPRGLPHGILADPRNGGTERGQADGFDLETLGKLDSVKDNVTWKGGRGPTGVGLLTLQTDAPNQQPQAHGVNVARRSRDGCMNIGRPPRFDPLKEGR